MNDSFGGDFNATQTATAGAVTDAKGEGIAPVLIRQILESPEGNYQMFGMTFGMVNFVAIVRSIDTSSTKITYLLEDHTGRIEAHYWLEEGDALKAPDLMLNNYAIVYGTVRSQGGHKTLMVFKMYPVTDPNQVLTHQLEVLNARYKSEEFASKGASVGGFTGFGGSIKMETDDSAGVSGGQGLEPKQLAVFHAIKRHRSPEGISRTELQKKFNHMNSSEMTNILDFMISEGHIYSSVDADHFVCTE